MTSWPMPSPGMTARVTVPDGVLVVSVLMPANLVVVGRRPPLSRRSSEAWTAAVVASRLRGLSGLWLAGPQSGYMSYMAVSVSVS